MAKKFSDKEILELWKNPTYKGSFSGVKTFQALLKTDFDFDISEKKLINLLKTEKIFLIHLKSEKRFPRRQYDLKFYGELVQADIAYMFPFENYKYFLLLIDCYSSKIFTYALKTLKAEQVIEAFKDIFSRFKAPIYKLQTDQGFTGKIYYNFMKKEHIVLSFKRGANKANFAENGIKLIKQKLYKALRSSLSKNWPALLPQIVENQNNIPLKKLGFLPPIDIQNVFDSVKVTLARQKNSVENYSSPTLKIQQKNQQAYEKDLKNLQVDDYVFLNFEENLFGKSFDVKVIYSMNLRISLLADTKVFLKL